ncbi:TPA: aromatic amino acid DMT transporter YddG [Pseudomonas aeruginosa]|uniref:aromatic amino acid DMT transporter YddG n=1 Tax=Pseudomonas TaxID=286 RepID=UPI000CD42092|nr:MULTISPECIES: aromatic amino acid DMT transporter YddG [Pseudomonas]MBH9519089.1 aromatic amino acid DMT transporter YddG [Pseudomonas aeruginosa]MBI8577246.1 aromatic amino acid DMT transporter YddG [Pseudomonas aeruginosa]MBI8804379.1 aromatic amino acid DMT transporter YddG [Pseudomonas aeruginosa]MCU9208632.1 aromatic amino acid DMT transporter YddG [Pseudomonas aeruginosa]MDA3374361.1 aromatic amino acid DMT transporter YddG [Pseudomonas aeruginosa]
MTIEVQSQQTKGNLLGVSAILLWSTMASLMRLLSEAFGPLGGAALMYTVATAVLILAMGWPSLKQFPMRYLVVVGGLFVAYEIALFLALAFAQNRAQAIEVAMLNHMWPCLTVVLAVLLGLQRASLWLAPGMALSLIGVSWILSGGEGLSISNMIENASDNPLSYGLGISCAFLWAFYCCISKRLSRGKDAIVPFFAMASVVLWIKYAFSNESLAMPDFAGVGLLIATAVVLALGYAAWNKALLTGNLVLLAATSYVSPVLSSVFSSIILSTTLRLSFWQGTVMVTAGSLFCWWASRRD